MSFNWVLPVAEVLVAVGTILLALVTYLSNRDLRIQQKSDEKRYLNEQRRKFLEERIYNYYTPLITKYYASVNTKEFTKDLIEILPHNQHLASRVVRHLIMEFFSSLYSDGKPSTWVALSIQIFKAAWKEYEEMNEELYKLTGENFQKLGNVDFVVSRLESVHKTLIDHGN